MDERSIDNPLRPGIAGMIVFATLMLGVGERSIVLTLVSLVAVTVSIYVTDVKKIFQLSQQMANCAALGIVVVATANALHVDRAGQIGVVASLQSYLQYVLLFQPKTPRIYWQLALLSLGQVAIAATLIGGILFGALLLVYVALAVYTFTVLLMHTESARFRRVVAAGGGAAVAGPDPAAQSLRATVLRGGVAPMPSGLVRGLFVPIVAVMLVTITVASTLFFFIPRWTNESRELPTSEPLRSVGFSRTITLGELGEVVQNSDVVMRISFFRGHSMRSMKLANEPLFRGSAVSRYRDGQWTQSPPGNATRLLWRGQIPYVRQHIVVEPMDVAELFCVVPVFGINPDQRLRIDTGGELLHRQEDRRDEQMEFEVATTGIVNDRQRMFLPCRSPLQEAIRIDLLRMPADRDGQGDPFAGLRATAASVISEGNIDPTDHHAVAKALHDFLRYSGEFSYSLQGQPRAAGVDPLEDFVTQHRAGHCEYFAGALVMMLRSQGIPARMAVGFKGGEWNAPGMYYQVQQLHAHAWVEAYLDGEDLPGSAFADFDRSPPGAWMVLDPTVSQGSGAAAGGRPSLLARLHQYFDYSQVLWANYVVGLNARRQQQGIYAPLAAGVRAGVENLIGPEIWQQRFERAANSPLGRFWSWYRRHWFDWRGGLVAIGTSLLLVAAYFALRRVVGLLRRLGLFQRGKQKHEPPTLEIYRRLEAALARKGFQRHSGQTAREFAVWAGGHMAESIELNRVSHLPRRIVESFYRVRFGGRTLDNREAEAVEHALRELELAMGRRR